VIWDAKAVFFVGQAMNLKTLRLIDKITDALLWITLAVCVTFFAVFVWFVAVSITYIPA